MPVCSVKSRSSLAVATWKKPPSNNSAGVTRETGRVAQPAAAPEAAGQPGSRHVAADATVEHHADAARRATIAATCCKVARVSGAKPSGKRQHADSMPWNWPKDRRLDRCVSCFAEGPFGPSRSAGCGRESGRRSRRSRPAARFEGRLNVLGTEAFRETHSRTRSRSHRRTLNASAPRANIESRGAAARCRDRL